MYRKLTQYYFDIRGQEIHIVPEYSRPDGTRVVYLNLSDEDTFIGGTAIFENNQWRWEHIHYKPNERYG